MNEYIHQKEEAIYIWHTLVMLRVLIGVGSGRGSSAQNNVKYWASFCEEFKEEHWDEYLGAMRSGTFLAIRGLHEGQIELDDYLDRTNDVRSNIGLMFTEYGSPYVPVHFQNVVTWLTTRLAASSSDANSRKNEYLVKLGARFLGIEPPLCELAYGDLPPFYPVPGEFDNPPPEECWFGEAMLACMVHECVQGFALSPPGPSDYLRRRYWPLLEARDNASDIYTTGLELPKSLTEGELRLMWLWAARSVDFVELSGASLETPSRHRLSSEGK